MLLSEFFNTYISTKEDVTEKWQHQMQLNSELNKLLGMLQNNGVKVMKHYIETILNTNVNPFDCMVFCNKLHLVTVSDFMEWSNSLEKSKIKDVIGLFTDVPPVLTGGVDTIQVNKLINNIKELIPQEYKEQDITINIPTDITYQILTLQDIKKIIKYDKTNRLRYIKESRDCDDFASLFKCAFRKLGLGNATIFGCVINLYSPQGHLIGGHAINLIYYEDNGHYLKLFEPQTDDIKDFGDLLFGHKYYKIRQINI